MPALPRRAGHLVVCGDGPLSYRITEELTSRYGEQVTVILPSRRRNHGPQISALPRVRVLEHPELRPGGVTPGAVICGLVTPADDHASPRLLPPGTGPADLVLAVADGTPRNPLTRRRHPARAFAGLLRRLVLSRFGLLFTALLGVMGIGFVLLATRYSPATGCTWG